MFAKLGKKFILVFTSLLCLQGQAQQGKRTRRTHHSVKF